MPAKMEKTRYPGIYRRGNRYVVVYYVNGRQKKESCRTLDEARRLKAQRTTEVSSGSYQEQSREPFAAYAMEWVERYQGNGRKGFREGTRDEYRRLLRDYAVPFFGERRRRKLTEVTPKDIADYIGWLCDGRAQAVHAHELATRRWREACATADSEHRPRPTEPRSPAVDARRELSDSTVRNMLNPVRSCFGSARAEGLVNHNPCADARLPRREQVQDEDGQEVRAFSREELAVFLRVVDVRHRLMFRFLAATGLRVSELLALQWRHLSLDGSSPHVRIRRAIVKGRIEPPKSKHGRRDVPLAPALVDELRAWHKQTEWPGDEDLVFPSQAGTPLMLENLRRRTLRPAAEEAGAAWAGFHTFRHTRASLLFANGANVVQVQRWLGHHSPSFTLDRYVHLLAEDGAAPLDLDMELARRGATEWQGEPQEPAATHRNRIPAQAPSI